MSSKIILPWPPTILSPNSRNHWAVLARARREYKTKCRLAALNQGLGPIDAETISVHFVFTPPTARRIDLDNCISRMKSGIDALADVIKIDDSQWRMSFEFSGEPGGFVSVTFSKPPPVQTA